MSTARERGEHNISAYRQGCRCRACRRALQIHAQVWWATRRLRAGADPASRVPAARMLRHLDALTAAGWSQRQVALSAGVAASTLTRARNTRRARISRIVEQAVLGVEP